MKTVLVICATMVLTLLIGVFPAFAQDTDQVNDIIAKMQTKLDLQPDQIYHVTPVIERYTAALNDLQKTIEDGTINPSAVDSQRRHFLDAETQEISPYLKAYQLSEWRPLQAEIYQQKFEAGDDANGDDSQYPNLPHNPSAEQ